MEQFPELTKKIITNGITAAVHYIYQIDTLPGLSVTPSQFFCEPSDDSKWIYDKFEFNILGVNEKENQPEEFQLYQNYPNPFNPETKINFFLPEESFVTLKIFNVLGEEIVILTNRQFSTGSHTINFNAANLQSGIYFYEMKSKGKNGVSTTTAKKMVLIK